MQAFIDGPYRELYGAARRTVVTPGDTVPGLFIANNSRNGFSKSYAASE